MRIAVFGGSFDPVHSEHIALVERAIECLALDRVFIVPACKPPHKPGKQLTDDAVRLEMCKLAFADNKKVVVSDYEIQKGGTSYTYQTCRHFKSEYPCAQLFWLVGTDMLRDFPTWKNTQSILADATLAVCARAEQEDWLQIEQKNFQRLFNRSFAVIDYNAKAVSSTRVRVLVGAGESVEELVPAPVLSFIKAKGLYTVKNADLALSREKPHRKEHSLRVAELAAKKAVEMQVSERKAIVASLFHDCAKNMPAEHPLLKAFTLPKEYGRVPESVWHQFAGAYLAQTAYGVKDAEVLNAIAYHTSGRAGMTELEKIVFLADMVEESRNFDGVERLRTLFNEKKGVGALDDCLRCALKQTVEHLKQKGADIYPLTLQAERYYQKKGEQNEQSNDE